MPSTSNDSSFINSHSSLKKSQRQGFIIISLGIFFELLLD